MLELLKVLDRNTDYKCGSLDTGFSGILPTITSTVVLIIEIGVPILLIIFGMLDLGKAVIAQKEDEIKKGQSMFFKRLIAAVLVFFVSFIVRLAVGFAAGDDKKAGLTSCLNCFINGDCIDTTGGSNDDASSIPPQ